MAVLNVASSVLYCALRKLISCWSFARPRLSRSTSSSSVSSWAAPLLPAEPGTLRSRLTALYDSAKSASCLAPITGSAGSSGPRTRMSRSDASRSDLPRNGAGATLENWSARSRSDLFEPSSESPTAPAERFQKAASVPACHGRLYTSSTNLAHSAVRSPGHVANWSIALSSAWPDRRDLVHRHLLTGRRKRRQSVPERAQRG